MKRFLLRLLYPPKCIFCEEVLENENFAVCRDCLAEISYNKRACRVCGTPLDTVYGEKLCPACRKKKRAFQKAYVPFIYKDAVRASILGFKFRGKRARAKTYAAFLLMKLKEEGAERPDVITFVPMHFIRRGKRGYNQAELLAKELGMLWSVPVEGTLRKTKHTRPQSRYRRKDRLTAPFKVYAEKNGVDIRGKKVLLVDDIITTGTTMQACARLLRKMGAKEIEIAAIAATAKNHG